MSNISICTCHSCAVGTCRSRNNRPDYVHRRGEATAGTEYPICTHSCSRSAYSDIESPPVCANVSLAWRPFLQLIEGSLRGITPIVKFGVRQPSRSIVASKIMHSTSRSIRPSQVAPCSLLDSGSVCPGPGCRQHHGWVQRFSNQVSSTFPLALLFAMFSRKRGRSLRASIGTGIGIRVTGFILAFAFALALALV